MGGTSEAAVRQRFGPGVHNLQLRVGAGHQRGLFSLQRAYLLDGGVLQGVHGREQAGHLQHLGQGRGKRPGRDTTSICLA